MCLALIDFSRNFYGAENEKQIRGAPRKASGDLGKGPTKHEKGPRRVLHEHRERALKGAPGGPGEGPRGGPGRRTGKGKGRWNQVMGALKKAPVGLKMGPKETGKVPKKIF
jgi:hypothetical protein